jgi:hypothetical protein
MASFDRFGRACPPASSRRHDWRRLLLLLCIPPAVLTLQAWNIWDPMGSLKKWFMDTCTGAWKYTASKVLTGSNMDDAMWATATDGLNKLAGVMAFVTVAAGAYGILRAAATQDIGGVLSAGARTALAWPLTVLCITLAVKGTSLASTMTKSILNTGSLGGSIPGIDKNSLDVFDSGLMTITLCVCVVLGSFVLLLMMAARNFLLIFAIVIAAIPLMLQGWSTMRPLVSKWAGWIVGIILMQPVMALCIWVTCKLMVMSSSTTTTLIAVVGMILSSIFPFTLIKQIADFIPGSVGLMRAGAAGAATVGTAASLAGAAAGLGIQGAAGLSGLASKAGEHGGKSGASGKDKSALSGANPMSSQGSPSEDLHDAKATGGTGGSQSKTSSEKQAETASSEGGSGSQTESSEGTTSDGVLGVAGAALAGSGFPRAGATVSALGRLYKNSQSNGNSGSSGQEGGSANAADATPNPSDGLGGGVSSETSASMQGQSIPSEAVDSIAPETKGNDPSGRTAGATGSAASTGTSGTSPSSPQSGMSVSASSMTGGEGSSDSTADMSAVPAGVAGALGVQPASVPAQSGPAASAVPSGGSSAAPAGASSQSASAVSSGVSDAGQSGSAVPAGVAGALGVQPASVPAQSGSAVPVQPSGGASVAPAGVPVQSASAVPSGDAVPPSVRMPDTPQSSPIQAQPAAAGAFPASVQQPQPGGSGTTPGSASQSSASPVRSAANQSASVQAPQAAMPANGPVRPSTSSQTVPPTNASPVAQPESGTARDGRPTVAVKNSDATLPTDKPGDIKADIGGGRSIKITRRGFHRGKR